MKLRLRAVGTSTGLALPKKILARLRVKKGDVVLAIETPEGYLLTPYDSAVERQLEIGREFAAQYRGAFCALAR